MLDFLRRIPALLGLKGKTEAKAPAASSRAAGSKAGEEKAKAPRGRGAGRGITPPAKHKGKVSPNRRRK